MSTLSNRTRRQRRNLRQSARHYQTGNLTQSVAACTLYTQRYPGDKTGHYNLALTLAATHQVEAATQAYRTALEIDPWYPEALNNLGILLHSQGQLQAAKILYARAMAARPNYEDAEYNYATAESSCGNLQDAVFHFSRVLERNPRRADAWNNLGNALLALRAPAEALQSFQVACALQPDLPDLVWNSAFAELTLGRLPRGWEGFEQRCRLRHTQLPRWDGSEIKDRSILVHAEQGFGDTIQFVRYCGQVKTVTSAKVLLECHSELIPLLRYVDGVDQFTGFGGEVVSKVDYQIPLMSLPLMFRSSLAEIPCSIPYLQVEADLIAEWARRMAAPERQLKVGLVWSGNPAHRNDRNRSMDPALLDVFGELRGDVVFYCLQQKPQSAGISSLRSLAFQNIFDELTMTDTAAILFNLDLLISVDTAAAHLAGALGRPVWTLLPYAPDWRWMLHRSDTPWYPSMRLFRQQRLSDWEGLLQEVIGELQMFQKAHQMV